MYHVLKMGKSVRKVSAVGASFPFSLASHICLEAKNKSLYIVSDKDLISKYSYQ